MEYVLIILFGVCSLIALGFLFYYRKLYIKEKQIKQQKFEEYFQEAIEKRKSKIQEALDKASDAARAQYLQYTNALEESIKIQESRHKEALEHSKQVIDLEINQYKEQKENELTSTIQILIDTLKDDYEVQEEDLQEKIKNLRTNLDEYLNYQRSINEAIQRKRKIEEQQDYYRIILTEDNKRDIEVLFSIEPRLKNKEALNKLIYEVFYKKPLTDMINRVLKGKEVCGIYRITNLRTQEAYIGKSTNIKNRWTQHIKTTLGIGTIANSSFHKVLKDEGIDNFSFEVLEECDKSIYGKRENYWIDFYDTKKFGYNEKDGG